MPPAVGFAIAGIASGIGAIVGAHKQSKAATHAADLVSTATSHAADLEAEANAKELAFKQEQAKRDYMTAEANRRANYDQWRAREGRLGTLGEMIGQGSRQLPEYVPLPAYSETGAPNQPGGGGTNERGPVMPPGSVGSYLPPRGSMSVPPGGDAGTVLMQAPDGSVRPVPQAHVRFYQSRGARVVQQGAA